MRRIGAAVAVLSLLVAAAASGAAEITPLRLGQAVWRAECTLVEHTPAGGQQTVRTDFYGFSLTAPGTVRIALRAERGLGALLAPAAAALQTLATVPAGHATDLPLTAGSYVIIVAGQADAEGSYLLSLTQPRAADARIATLAPSGGGQPAFRGEVQLPCRVNGLAAGLQGLMLATHDGVSAWLHDLTSLESYKLDAPPGRILRVAFATDGWSVMVVSEGGARLFALPDLTPFASFKSVAALADAVFTGAGQKLAVLPRGGNAFLTSPIPDDVSVVPGSAGLALEGDPLGERLAVRYAGTRITLYETRERRPLGHGDWAAAPTGLALDPTEPALATAGAGSSRLWRAGAAARDLPDQVAVAFLPDGELFGSDGQTVSSLGGEKPQPLAPAFPATLLAGSARGQQLAAATADGRVALWEVLGHGEAAGGTAADAELAQASLTQAKMAYADGLTNLRAQKYREAHDAFVRARELLDRQSPEGETISVLCLAWLRSAMASNLMHDYDTSRTEAEELIKRAAAAPAEQRRYYVSIGLYCQADALWSKGDHAAARPLFQRALDEGLEDPSAADARDKLKQ